MKYIDVTLTLEHGMRGVQFSPAKILKNDGWNAQTLQLYSHAGTHMDAPVHFEVSSGTIDQFPAERFFNTCYVVDLLGIQPKTEITVQYLSLIHI